MEVRRRPRLLKKGEDPGYRKKAKTPAIENQAKTPARGGRLQYHNSVVDRELSLQLHFFCRKKVSPGNDSRRGTAILRTGLRFRMPGELL